MKGKKETQPAKRPLALHPFLFAIYPILYIYARNLDETTFVDLLRPAAVVLVFAGLLLLLARALFKDRLKSSILVSVVMIMIFTYGHVLEPIRGAVLAGYIVGHGSIIGPLWCLLFLILFVCVVRTRANLEGLNRFANTLGVLLVAIAVAETAIYQAQPSSRTGHLWYDRLEQSVSGENALRPESGKPLPDIYYIILDAYARQDILADSFGYDNSEFIEYLQSKGFYVGRQSASNYTSTYYSLSSSLNFDYLHALVSPSHIDVRLLGRLINDCKVVRLLKDAGYKFVFFPSGFHVTNRNPYADTVITRSNFTLSEFDRVLLDSTIFKHVNPAYRCYAANILYTFDELPKVAQMEEPTFTFAHITMPHRPYLFDAEGRRLGQSLIAKDKLELEEYRTLYVGQLTYLNKRMRTVIDEILSRSATPPVIIIQGDHGLKGRLKGPRPRITSGILNAYYLPDGGDKLLYPGVSPVNSFRIVFNQCFGTDYELLEDITYEVKPAKKGRRFLRVSR